MAQAILVLNAGSSSLKFSVFLVRGAELELWLKGQAEGLYTSPRFVAKDAEGKAVSERRWGEGESIGHEGAIAHLMDFLAEQPGDHRLIAVGHRVVHGGRGVLRADPAHPRGGAEAGEARPARTAAPAAQPRADPLRPGADAGPSAGGLLRHRVPPRPARAGPGLCAARGRSPTAACAATASTGSPTSTSPARSRAVDPKAAAGRVVVAHLGNGASMCAMHAGQERGQHHGLHRGGWAAHGHPLRLHRPRGGALPDGRAEDGCPGHREADLPAVRPARGLRHLERHAGAALQ